MDAKLYVSHIGGSIAVPPSKSAAHRAVLSAALATGTSHIHNIEYSDDIRATIDGMPFFAISWPVTIAHWAVRGIHNRAQLVPQEGMVDNALDPYIQTRDVFLMYDENAINPVEEGEVEAEDNFDDALLDEIDG